MNTKRSKNLLAIIALLSFSLTLSPTMASTKPLTQAEAIASWGGNGVNASGLWLLEDFNLGADPSALYRKKEVSSKTELTLCEGLTDKNCVSADSLYQILNLDVCTARMELSCIVNFWAKDPSGKRIEGELVRSIPFEKKQYVEESLGANLPSSHGYGAIWKLPGVMNGGGNENYFVATRVTMFRNSKEKFEFGEIESGIIPINEIQGNYGIPVLQPVGGRTSDGPITSPSGDECIAFERGICRERVDFPATFKFGITLRIADNLNGWYHGRLSSPEIQVKKWKLGQEISVEGLPVKVPSLDFVVPYADLSVSARQIADECAQKQCGGRGNRSGIWQLVGNLNHPDTFAWLKAFNKDYQDRSTKTKTFWSFKKMFNHAGQLREDELRRCGERVGDLTGVVLTNSLAYSSGPPAYDSKTGALVYSVSSPHYESNGEVASGTYDLTLRSEVARCIYGFSNAPIKAEISITGDDGEKRVATTVVNEKDGWLYLSAKGFTFSAPTIQVKLSQDVVAKVEEVKASGVAPKIVPAKKSITCVKGKSTKKVVGPSPKCPTGYKKR